MGWTHGDEEEVREYQKWDYLNLSDFRDASCGKTFSYGWLWFLFIISIAVYGSDTYIAVVLLVFDHWPSQFQPTIPLNIAKWIFAACILFSWVLLGYEMFRAIRVMRRGSVAESYLDPNAVNLQSMRLGSGQGFRRFLVFAELTKSRKGADYVAIFAYFQFQGAIRILLAEGPRQVVNALILYSVMQAQLLPNQVTSGHSNFVQFWLNVKALATTQQEHAAILFTMLFTLTIWVFSAICFAAAVLLYVFFLWHYIPSGEGGLTGYCRKKVDKRLEKIVGTKVQKAIAKAEAKRLKDEAFQEKFAGANGGPFAPVSRKPTLPSLLDESLGDTPKPLSRTTTGSSQLTQTTLPPYPGQQPKLPFSVTPSSQDNRSLPSRAGTPASVFSNTSHPNGPQRTATGASNSTFRSNRPLLGEAAEMGYSMRSEEADYPGNASSGAYGLFRKPLPVRSMTGGSLGSQASMERLQQPTPSVAVLQPGPLRTFSNAQRSASPSPISRTPSPAFYDGSSSMYEMQPQRRTPSPPQQEPAPRGPYQAYRPYRPESPAMQPSALQNNGRSTPILQAPRRAFTDPIPPDMSRGMPSSGLGRVAATPPPRIGTAPLPTASRGPGGYFNGNSYSGPGPQEYSRPPPRQLYGNGSYGSGDSYGSAYGYSSGGRR